MLPALLLWVNKYYMVASKPTGEGSVLATTVALTVYLAENKQNAKMSISNHAATFSQISKSIANHPNNLLQKQNKRSI